jgi:nucleotide-binding universal stress UspA family protein
MFERILVPLDGSKNAEMVVPYAIELASMYNSTIVIAGVSESSGVQALNESRAYLETQSYKVSKSLEKRQGADASRPLRAKVGFQSLVGSPAAEILKYATIMDSNLIILASRGSSNSGPGALGNVADKVLKGANCPVLLIREPLEDPIIALKYITRKILVPLDGSKLSEAALPLAAGIAWETGAEIVLLQVIEPITLAIFGNLTPEEKKQYNENSNLSTLNYLEKTKTSLENIHASIAVAAGERPVAESIIDYSEAQHCDLIVISTNGRSGISRWVFGSITEKILHAGKKPVLVVRPKQ